MEDFKIWVPVHKITLLSFDMGFSLGYLLLKSERTLQQEMDPVQYVSLSSFFIYLLSPQIHNGISFTFIISDLNKFL